MYVQGIPDRGSVPSNPKSDSDIPIAHSCIIVFLSRRRSVGVLTSYSSAYKCINLTFDYAVIDNYWYNPFSSIC